MGVSELLKIRGLGPEGKHLESIGIKRLHPEGPIAYLRRVKGGVEIYRKILTKLPRTVHFPAFSKLSPGTIAAAHTPSPGGETAQLPVPPTCKETRHPQAQGLVAGEAGEAVCVCVGCCLWGWGVLSVTGRGQDRCEQR